MAIKKINIFNREHIYENLYEIKTDIAVMQQLSEKIKKAQILSYQGMETVDFFIPEDEDFISSDCIKWIAEQMKKITDKTDIRKILLACAIEDTAWTKERNKEFKEVVYRKITFNKDVQEIVRNKLKKYISEAEKLYFEMQNEEDEKKRIAEKRKQDWEIKGIYKKLEPRGGENGQDGYIDADYCSPIYGTIRMVNRDVFDVGCYSYPKRFEGTDNVLKNSAWSVAEKDLAAWLSEYGFGHRIRM